MCAAIVIADSQSRITNSGAIGLGNRSRTSTLSARLYRKMSAWPSNPCDRTRGEGSVEVNAHDFDQAVPLPLQSMVACYSRYRCRGTPFGRHYRRPRRVWLYELPEKGS